MDAHYDAKAEFMGVSVRDTRGLKFVGFGPAQLKDKKNKQYTQF